MTAQELRAEVSKKLIENINHAESEAGVELLLRVALVTAVYEVAAQLAELREGLKTHECLFTYCNNRVLNEGDVCASCFDSRLTERNGK